MNFDFVLQNVGQVVGDDTTKQNYTMSYSCRVILVEQGSGTICCGNEMHSIVPGHLYLIPPLITHSVHIEGPFSLSFVTFTDQSMRIYDHFHLYRYNLEIEESQGIEQLISHIAQQAPQFCIDHIRQDSYDAPYQTMKRVKAFQNIPAANQMSINGLLHFLLSKFMDSNAPGASVSDIRISKAVWEINRDLAHAPSLDEISAHACLNKNTFIRLFRLQTGFTPTDYIIHRRILQAQFLFISGNRSVKEVAHQVGYDNISYFGRTFKKIVGMSPLHFIHQNE